MEDLIPPKSALDPIEIASRDEIAETIGVAVLMGGGPSVVYGAEALDAVEQFEAD